MINKTCPLILRDLYFYDIVSAFPTILSRQFFDFGEVSLDNKGERNMFIGKKQINNPGLASFLTSSVNSLVDYYLKSNQIQDDEIIFRQKDGFILTRPLVKCDGFIEMKLRNMLSMMIISPQRNKMIYFDEDGKLSVKGVPYHYDELDTIYNSFFNLSFYDPKILCTQLQSIKDKVLNCKDKKFYAIEKEEGVFIFITLKGNVQVRDFGFVRDDLIDREKYFQHFFKEFIDSIFLEVLK